MAPEDLHARWLLECLSQPAFLLLIVRLAIHSPVSLTLSPAVRLPIQPAIILWLSFAVLPLLMVPVASNHSLAVALSGPLRQRVCPDTIRLTIHHFKLPPGPPGHQLVRWEHYFDSFRRV